MLAKNYELHNVAEVVTYFDTDQKVLSRIPDSLRKRLNPLAQITAFNAAGTEIRFLLKSGKAKITCHVLNGEDVKKSGGGIIEILHGCFPEPEFRFVTGSKTEIIVEEPEKIEVMEEIAKRHHLSFQPRLIRVLLPYHCHIAIDAIEGDIELAAAEDVPEVRMLAYGSSITNGFSSVTTQSCYIMKTAARLGVDLFNLGFAGSAMLEAEMADYIAARKDWDVLFLELGINVVWNVVTNQPGDPSSFEQKVDYFLKKVAGENKDKYVICTDIYTGGGDYAGDNTLAEEFRAIVGNKVRELELANLVYLKGQELLPTGEGIAGDTIHPGMMAMDTLAENLTHALKTYVKKASGFNIG